ncbi:AMIN domain-containing protein [Phormidesmis priestleyi ULC007]|uniref:AMIN domain-containing protein n=1 Tax=Phormidesmis priestleyi ULC007 TaxID=1920490 RepID=A0A2T1D3V7_9CYAN|nr:AMIN domain-containing protein [Phormidesmis priestleyi]PSB15141.1 AMIN domain-containing protein [Phormidesmis priestleyi ULC007]PZO45907.1 MAG: AMIN domain-containing protein [Phormidesmis priestleyi]
MKKKSHNGLGKGIFYLASLAVCLDSAPAWAAPLTGWQYDPTANQLEVTLKDGVKPRYFLMARPARIVLDLPDTEVGSVQRQQTYEGAVRQVRVSQVKPGLTRIVLELSPDATLLRGQAQLQRVGDAEQSSDRWVLRPLLAQAATKQPATTSSLPPTAIDQAPPVVYPPGILPTQPEVSAPREADRAIPNIPDKPISDKPISDKPISDKPISDKPIDIAVSRPTVTPPLSTNLPPTTVPPVVAEPTSPKIANSPTPPSPENFPPGIAPSLEPSVTKPASPDVSPQVPTSNSEPSPRIVQKPAPSLQLPEINPSLAIPDSLPPVTVPNSATAAPSVSVPPLNRAPIPNSASDLPPAGVSNPATAVTVPPLEPTVPQAAIVNRSAKSGQINTIEFGQPLPTLPVLERSSQQPPGLISYNSGAIVPAGTVLSLRYPGSKALSLQADQPRQEVLVLQNSLRDRAGNLIAPEGTEVLGKFETIGGGSRFIAQAILLQGQNVAIVAQSEVLGGARKVSNDRLIRNSGIGAVAGAILGGLSGGNVIGGAAAGAAVTYVTAPKSATIQPGQILDVRLTEDLR